ncbi:hypothetical protein SAMN04487935_3635 [Flavobacterium noncentrifugens]|uniref:Uncharacterized protein n=1 Tax=Flavobacterium noncentrifugens TaxID=1128970 RepID=A0A1G9CSC7_9FLAO|nr:hypothetical protein SAMN04487935_3635 [Flavobacterium noncentrifugens]
MLSVDKQQRCSLTEVLLTVIPIMAVCVNKIMILHFFNFKKLLILVAVTVIKA